MHRRLDGTHVGGSSLSSSYLRLQVDAVDPALACKVVRGEEEEETSREAVEAPISGTTGIGPNVECVFAAAPQHCDPEKGSSRCSRGHRQSREGCVFLPRWDTYSARVKVAVKVLDFVQLGGPRLTVDSTMFELAVIL